jgi:hypothetical protein
VLKESGKVVEKTTTRYESIAEGLVSGLQLLHVEVSGDDKTYTLVLGWDAATARAAGKIDDTKEDNKKPDGGKKPGEGKKPADKKVRDKKVTSDEAKKILP